MTEREDDESAILANSEGSVDHMKDGRELVRHDWEVFAKWASSRWALCFLVTLIVLATFRAWFSVSFAAWNGTLQYTVIDQATYCVIILVGTQLFGYVALRIHRSLREAGHSTEKPVLGRLTCPHCGALYSYMGPSIGADDTVECQNCATRFAVPKAAPSGW